MMRRFVTWAVSKVLNYYEGAQTFFGNTLLRGPNQAAHLDISKATREEIRRKAYFFEKNHPLVQKLAGLFEQYVVGQGIQFFPASSNTDWNLRAKATWDTWRKYAAVDNLQGFDSLQGIMARRWFIDGEIFVYLLTSDQGFPRIQLLESMRCKTPPKLATREGKDIFDGVQVDKNGRPVAYYFDDSEKPIPADKIVHIFEPERPGQYRGISFFASCIKTLHDLSDLQMFEMQAAKRAARTTDVVKKGPGQNTADILKRLKQGAATHAAAATPMAGAVEYLTEINGAKPVILDIGEEYTQYKSDRPSVVVQSFWQKLEASICAAVEIPYILVYPESMQGTVFRGAIDSAAATFRSRYAALVIHLTRIYEFAIENQLRLIGAPPIDWRNVDSRPPKAVNVDVGRNSSAVINEIAAGIRSHQGVIAEDGGDWKAVLRQKAETWAYVNELAAKYSVEPDKLISSGLPAASTQPTQGAQTE